jgi:mRNA interferase MazF
MGGRTVSTLVRGRVYRARPSGFTNDKFFVVVSNNNRNRSLESVLVVRFTTSTKPAIASIVEIPSTEVLPAGRVVCDDIYDLYEDEVNADIGALSAKTMAAVNEGLKAALSLT